VITKVAVVIKVNCSDYRNIGNLSKQGQGRYVVTQLDKALCYKPEDRGFEGLGVDPASNRNDYQGYLLRCKGGR
jgi:hypothetical protein